MKCRKNRESKNLKVASTKHGIIMLLSKCAACDSKISKYAKQQDASGLLSSLGIKKLLSKILLVWPLLFQSSKNLRQDAKRMINICLK